MEKFSTEYFHKLANDLKFDLSDEEIEELKKDFVAVEEQVSLFEKSGHRRRRTYGLSF